MQETFAHVQRTSLLHPAAHSVLLLLPPLPFQRASLLPASQTPCWTHVTQLQDALEAQCNQGQQVRLYMMGEQQ
jgi:hypothetical protein